MKKEKLITVLDGEWFLDGLLVTPFHRSYKYWLMVNRMSGESKGVTSCPENVKEKSWTENGLSIIDFSFHFHDNFFIHGTVFNVLA